MRTINIRQLRGSKLAECARKGELVGITDYRELAAVFVPVTPAWVEHLIEYNWSHVRQSIVEGEQEIAGGAPLTTLDGLLAGAHGHLSADTGQPAGDLGNAQRLAAAAVIATALGGDPAHLPAATEVLKQFQVAAGAPESAADDGPSVRTVRVGDLSAALIKEAGAAGQTLALTHDRVLAGIVVPVTRGLVEFLVEQNMSRVLYNIGLGEKEISQGERLTTLSQAVSARTGKPSAAPPASRRTCDA